VVHRLVSCSRREKTGGLRLNSCNIAILSSGWGRVSGAALSCIVLGISSRNKIICGDVSHSSRNEIHDIEPPVMRIIGSPFGFVSTIESNIEPGTSVSLVLVGGANGCVRILSFGRY
jgi:hypothetical protein